MESKPGEPAGGPMTEKEMEEQLRAFQASQQAYLEETFRWLIEFIASYFPEDQLAVRDLDLEVHFVHRVMEGGEALGVLVYRFRKFVDKKDYFTDMGEDYQEGMEVPEVLFVDSETSKFEPPLSLETEGNFLEIPGEKLTGRIRELREEIKRRSKLRQLRQSL